MAVDRNKGLSTPSGTPLVMCTTAATTAPASTGPNAYQLGWVMREGILTRIAYDRNNPSEISYQPGLAPVVKQIAAEEQAKGVGRLY